MVLRSREQPACVFANLALACPVPGMGTEWGAETRAAPHQWPYFPFPPSPVPELIPVTVPV